MPKTITKCQNCGKEFSVWPSRMKADVVCCSVKCASEYKIAHRTMNAVCPICEKQFYVKKYHLEKFKMVCCSRDCSLELRRIRMTGENNHQWGVCGDLNASFKGKFTVKKNNRLTDVYAFVKGYARAKDGRVKIHNMIVEENHALFGEKFFEEINGRKYLKRGFEVHHIDGNHNNNETSNLMIVTRSQHTRIHNKIKPRKHDAVTGRFITEKKHGFPIPAVELVESDELSETARGAGGYGSTGK